jgi:hypothetical protein
MAKSKLDFQVQTSIRHLIKYLNSLSIENPKLNSIYAQPILSIAQAIKDYPEAIHEILLAERSNVIDRVLTYCMVMAEEQINFPIKAINIILDAALPRTFATMSDSGRACVYQWASTNYRLDLKEKLLNSLSEEARSKLLNPSHEDHQTYLIKKLKLQTEIKPFVLIRLLLHANRLSEAAPFSLQSFAYAVLSSKNEADFNLLIDRLPLEKRGITLSNLAFLIYDGPMKSDARREANETLISCMNSQDITDTWQKDDVLGKAGLKHLIREIMKYGRDDLIEPMLDQIFLKEPSNHDLLRDILKYAANYKRIDIIKLSLACYAYCAPAQADKYAAELAHWYFKKIKDFADKTSLFSQEIEQLILLIREGLLPSEAYTRLKEAPQIAFDVLTQDNILIADLAQIVVSNLAFGLPIKSSRPPTNNNLAPSTSTSPSRIMHNAETNSSNETKPIFWYEWCWKLFKGLISSLMIYNTSSAASFSSTISSSITTTSLSTEEGDESPRVHMCLEHKSRETSPHTSWQQRHKSPQNTASSTSSMPLSSNRTRSESFAASSEQNIVTVSESLNPTSKNSWSARVNKDPSNSLNR